MDTSNIEPYLQQYRESLQRQREQNEQLLNQNRDTDYANIMSGANRAGVMYSNFPERSKVQYQTSTYLPGLEKNYTTYQTGLNKIRNNVLEYANKIKSLQEAIADLNKA